MRRTKPYKKEFCIPLPEKNLYIRVGFDSIKGKITDFRVQLELRCPDSLRIIRRYDTAHGKPHTDKYDLPDYKTGEYDKVFFSSSNLNLCMSNAINYLKEHYINIFNRYKRRHKNDLNKRNECY